MEVICAISRNNAGSLLDGVMVEVVEALASLARLRVSASILKL